MNSIGKAKGCCEGTQAILREQRSQVAGARFSPRRSPPPFTVVMMVVAANRSSSAVQSDMSLPSRMPQVCATGCDSSWSPLDAHTPAGSIHHMYSA